jgi:hypothetical protein
MSTNYPWQYAANNQAAQQGGLGGMLGQAQGITPGQAMGGLLHGGLGGAQGAAANYQYGKNYQQGLPLPQFEENVPDDELVFEGKLPRFADNLSAMLGGQQWPPKRMHHGIDCCQRMLML